MRIGYGFGRKRADFDRVSIDRLYLDGPATKRLERQDMVRHALRRGDTLVLLRLGDLGAGKGLRNLRSELEARGVSIEIAQQEPEEKKPMGRPPAHKADPGEFERFHAMWKDPAVDGAYIIDQACEAHGEDKADPKARARVRQRLIRQHGKRKG